MASALGYTIQHPTEDRFVLAASELRHRIAVLMGGRAAEVLLFEDDISTGAADDLQRATGIATEMVTLYGMAETVGQSTNKPAPQGFLSRQALDKPVASEAILREIDLSVRDIVADAFDEARAILMRRRADLDRGAELLLAKKVVTAADFPAIQQPNREAARHGNGFSLIFSWPRGFRRGSYTTGRDPRPMVLR